MRLRITGSSSSRSADLVAPEGGVIGGEVAVRHPEKPRSSTVSPAVCGTMVWSQIAMASETWVAEISPKELRISVVPFSTSRPRILAVALALNLLSSVAPKR